jgi:rhodanese-related sulfurtransferase
MNEYELDGNELVLRERASERAVTLDQERYAQRREPANRTCTSSIEQMLSAARARLQRYFPNDAYEAVVKTQAILVDIRSEGQRSIEGSIPGALVVERNVLEWRFDPASNARLPVATDHDLQVIVFCSEGYTSSLAGCSAARSRTLARNRRGRRISCMACNRSADRAARRNFSGPVPVRSGNSAPAFHRLAATPARTHLQISRATTSYISTLGTVSDTTLPFC